tara:strand:- start:2122 stop:2724 length:603 start_codon:yes stop_codon:yes gene_type:complete
MWGGLHVKCHQPGDKQPDTREQSWQADPRTRKSSLADRPNGQGPVRSGIAKSSCFVDGRITDVSDEVALLLGYYARVQTLIEMLVQFRLRPLPDVRQGLGAAYFEQMSVSTRKRWLKSLGSTHLDQALGSSLETAYAEVADVRNQLAHSPMSITPNGKDNPHDIRVGSARWIGKPLPAARDLARSGAAGVGGELDSVAHV